MGLAEERVEKYFGKKPGPFEQRYLVDQCLTWSQALAVAREVLEVAAQEAENDALELPPNSEREIQAQRIAARIRKLKE